VESFVTQDYKGQREKEIMPKKVEQIAKAIMRDSNKSKSSAYAIANYVYGKMKKKKKKKSKKKTKKKGKR